jgi:multidrug efflux pump subunit AcrA (membrane-fusion protein)
MWRFKRQAAFDGAKSHVTVALLVSAALLLPATAGLSLQRNQGEQNDVRSELDGSVLIRTALCQLRRQLRRGDRDKANTPLSTVAHLRGADVLPKGYSSLARLRASFSVDCCPSPMRL